MEWSRIECSFLSLSHVARNWQTAVRLLKSQAQHNQAKNQKSRHGLYSAPNAKKSVFTEMCLTATWTNSYIHRAIL